MYDHDKQRTAFEKHFSTDAIDDIKILSRLIKPTGVVDVVLDTDAFNEIDDQYAIAYLINSDDRLNLKAIFAAPFFNAKSATPADGMEKSYNEIINILTLMERDDLKSLVYRGSNNFLADELTPVASAAANKLVSLAMQYTAQKPLYVVAIGAITNIASALIMQPDIKDRIVLIWLGGNALEYPHNKEFNLYQDVAAARVVFGCGVALVQLPCSGVVSSFSVSGPELEYHLRGKNKLCDYLVDVTIKEADEMYGGSTWTRVIWDVTAVAWLLGDYMDDCIEHVPTPEYDDYYSFNRTNHLYKYVYNIHRDDLFAELFSKLTK